MSGQGPLLENARAYPFCSGWRGGCRLGSQRYDVGSWEQDRSFVWLVLMPGGARSHATTSEPSAEVNIQGPVS